MTGLDMQYVTLFQTVLGFDGRTVCYRRGGVDVSMRVMVDDVTEESTSQDGVILERKIKSIAFLVADFADIGKPMDTDRVILDGVVYGPVRNSGKRLYDYEDVGERVMVVLLERLGEAA